MFKVGDNPIIASEEEVLNELRRQVLLNGQDLFRVFKPSGRDNIMTNCPFHKGGQERKPSFGISRVDMKCHCFTCGWAGQLDEMISNVFGHDDSGDFGRKWLSRNFLTVAVETRKPLEINISRGAQHIQKAAPGFTEAELDGYRYFHPYMYKRGLTDEIIEQFDIGYDDHYVFKDNFGNVKGVLQCLTFPVYEVDGTPAFIGRRGVNTKFFHYPEEAQKPVYLADRFVSGQYKEAVICESFLNALTCWKYGKPAMALIGTGTEYQYKILRELPVRKYVLGFDPDEAGQKATDKFRRAMQGKKVLTYLDIPKDKDINDLQEEFLSLPEYF